MILEWVKYTQMYKSKKGGILSGDKVYSMLAKTISDRNIAPLIHSLRSASEFQGLANGMQTAMFRKWLDSNTNPKAVLDELFFSLLVGNSKIDIWLRYVNEFNAKNKFNRLFSGDDIFNSLRWKASGEGNLAALIVGIKSKFREDMKASLFKMWIDDDVKPESVNSILAGAKLEDKVRNTLENEYMAAYGSEVIRRAGIERKRM
ncbi:RxLR effector protein [Phytophthora megakarya]|uniref:RxLR effector protein n=1 Tax=Phytophthora megakarya TaxID=4795 RepID=A0A225WFC0_9STRA|nr:RxLR effector protein [Phytophthora megakarya]